MSRLYLWFNPCAFLSLLSHTGLRAQSAPGFPCALCQREEQRICKAQAKSRRENESACSSQLSSPGLTGRSSIPEAEVIEPSGLGVLDHPLSRVMTPLGA